MIHLICALQCEANPLIQHYRLKLLGSPQPFSVYGNDNKSISLTITGIGRLNAAAGTAYTKGFLESPDYNVWLNIGTAGHKSMEIGNAVLAHRIIDNTDNTTWYPQFVFKPPCLTYDLKTLEKPSTEYDDFLFDMEAAGFFATAIQFATSELIHSLKIISDNNHHPAAKPDKSFIEKLVAENIGLIDKIINTLGQLSLDLYETRKSPEYFNECTDRWHFTQYEKNSLSRLLIRWNALCPEQNPLQYGKKINNGKEMISYLQNTLDQLPVKLSK